MFQDVFILDTCRSCFVWVGSGASPNEKKNGFGYAHVSFLPINVRRVNGKPGGTFDRQLTELIGVIYRVRQKSNRLSYFANF